MKRKGFTLIELMVVVVIIGILAAIAIPNFMRMQQRAKEGSVKNNMHTVQLAVEDFATLNSGAYAGGFTAVTGETGETIVQLLPGLVHCTNPFTGLATVATEFLAADPKLPAGPGVLAAGVYSYGSDATGAALADGQRYAIHGGGATGLANLSLILANY